MKECITKTVHVVWTGDGIARVAILEGASIDLPEVVENYNAINRITKGQPFVELIDCRANFMITHDARTYASLQLKTSSCQAIAVVTDSFVNRLVSNFFVQFHKPPIPVKTFTDFNEAEKWLRQY